MSSRRNENEEEGATVVPFPGPEERAALENAPEGDDLDLAELREALEDLRQEIRVRLKGHEPHSSDEARDVPDFDWMALFDELRRRVNSFGMVERSGEVDEFGMDEVVLRRFQGLLDFLMDTYWRIEVRGLENLPADGRMLLVANRSGLLPYDGVMLAHALQRHHPERERARFLVADWLITLPFVQPYLARIGGVRACRENADRLLRAGKSVIAFPEGVKGAAKVFRERYRLRRFGRGGVVRTAIENRVPLVPVGIVGAEEAHPILFKWHLPARAVGLPFVPVTPTFPLFGAFGLLPLPTKWIVTIGEPIALGAEDGPEAVEDSLLVSRLNEALRDRIEALVAEGLESRESVWD